MTKQHLHKQMEEVQKMITKFVEVCEVYQDPNSTEEEIANIFQKSFENSDWQIYKMLEKVHHSTIEQYKRNREKKARAINKAKNKSQAKG